MLELFGGEAVSDIFFKVTNTWQDEENTDNKGTEVSFFNSDGIKIGNMHVNSSSWMDGDNKILSTNIGFNEIEENGNWGDWLGGSWTNYDSQNTSDTSDDELRDSGSNSRVTKEISAVTLPAGITVADTVSEIVVETGTNRWVDPQGKESTSDFTRYFVETTDQMTFLGGTETQNDITRIYDGDWQQLSQTAEIGNLKDISDATYTYANAAKVLELFGGEAVSDIFFKVTNTWQDEENTDNKGTEVSFFNSDGIKIGNMHVNSSSWMDGDNKILSTNIGFNEIEENGNWGDWLGGSWTNYDSQNTSDTSDDELRDSGSNSRVTKEISAVTLPAGITVADTVSEIVVETGTNRWVDPQGKESTSDFTRYFVKSDENGETFLGGTETQNDITRIYDGDWQQLSQTAEIGNLKDISDATYTYANAAKVLELFGGEAVSDIFFKVTNTWQDEENTDNKGTEVSFFNSDGIKIGNMHVNSSSWMDGDNKILSTNIGFNEIEENGNWGDWLGGSWTNYDSQNTSDTSDDELRDSGSNSRVTKEISAVTLPTGITVADTVSEIVVETGTNRWVDPQGKESTSDFTRYFVETS